MTHKSCHSQAPVLLIICNAKKRKDKRRHSFHINTNLNFRHRGVCLYSFVCETKSINQLNVNYRWNFPLRESRFAGNQYLVFDSLGSEKKQSDSDFVNGPSL